MRGKRSDDDAHIRSLIDQFTDTHHSPVIIDDITFDLPDHLNSATFREIVTRGLAAADQLARAGEAAAQSILDLQIFLDPDHQIGNWKLGKVPCYQQAVRAIKQRSRAGESTINANLGRLRSELPTTHPHHQPLRATPKRRTISLTNTYKGTIIDMATDLRRRLYDGWDINEGINHVGNEGLIEQLEDLTDAIQQAIVYLSNPKETDG